MERMKTFMRPLGRLVMLAAVMVAMGSATPWAQVSGSVPAQPDRPPELQLRELYPGITVDQNGTIRIRGEVVSHLTEKQVTRSIRGDPKTFAELMNGIERHNGNGTTFEPDESDLAEKEKAGQNQTKATPLPGVTMTEAKTTDLMSGSRSCINYSWVPTKNVCCLWCKKSFGGLYCCLYGDRFDIKYWEPSALIEVSCRNGYSMMNPGKVKGRGNNALQTCQGFNKPGNSRWFFEARVWAINGYDGGLRHQGAGPVNGERMRQCTMESTPGDLPWPGYKSNVPNGYAKKWDKFDRGTQNGPSGSWEGYISDGDPSWAQDGGGASVPNQAACQIGSVDMEKCWGPVTENGWVSHPNPKVAAALVAWRAHQKAVKSNKVSPAGKGGYKMAMEYPWLNYAGEHGASMGFESGGKKGSGCFQPGHSGPGWFGGKQPSEIPGLIAGLQQGDVTTVSEINPGVYIFTIWVQTSCTRFKTPIPTPLCHYEAYS